MRMATTPGMVLSDFLFLCFHFRTILSNDWGVFFGTGQNDYCVFLSFYISCFGYFGHLWFWQKSETYTICQFKKSNCVSLWGKDFKKSTQLGLFAVNSVFAVATFLKCCSCRACKLWATRLIQWSESAFSIHQFGNLTFDVGLKIWHSAYIYATMLEIMVFWLFYQTKMISDKKFFFWEFSTLHTGLQNTWHVLLLC